jgi:hypothetical protein
MHQHEIVKRRANRVRMSTLHVRVNRATTFDVDLNESGWLALRILPSAHTQAFRITVADSPARPLRASAEWCANAVDRLWAEKGKFIAQHEREEAKNAYAHASDEYRRRAAAGR